WMTPLPPRGTVLETLLRSPSPLSVPTAARIVQRKNRSKSGAQCPHRAARNGADRQTTERPLPRPEDAAGALLVRTKRALHRPFGREAVRRLGAIERAENEKERRGRLARFAEANAVRRGEHE